MLDRGFDLTLAGLLAVSTWAVSLATTLNDGLGYGAITVAFSGAISMLWAAQRRQRRMLLETIDLAAVDRDAARAELAEARRELHDLKLWIVEHLEAK